MPVDHVKIAERLLYVVLGCGITAGALAVIHEFRPAEVFAVITMFITVVTLIYGVAINSRKPSK